MTDETVRARVSVGIPLYAARPWVDRIVGNIRRNTAPDIEFVLADQHGLDDAMDIVKRRVEGIRRVRFFSSRTGAGWIDSYNLLLREADGEYFRILAQDDVLHERSLAAARAALDADPATVLVVGPADLIDAGGNVVWRDARLPASPLPPIGWASRMDALRLFAGSRYDNANLGLFRRTVATMHGLSIPHTAGESGLSMRALLFALALRGRMQYRPDYVSQRCVHQDSYTARHFRRSFAAELQRARSYLQVGTAAWRAGVTSRFGRRIAVPAISTAVVSLVARRALQRKGPQCCVVVQRQDSSKFDASPRDATEPR